MAAGTPSFSCVQFILGLSEGSALVTDAVRASDGTAERWAPFRSLGPVLTVQSCAPDPLYQLCPPPAVGLALSAQGGSALRKWWPSSWGTYGDTMSHMPSLVGRSYT
jgi:hypothetical protein